MNKEKKTLGVYLPAALNPTEKKEVLEKIVESNIDNVWLSDKFIDENAFKEINTQAKLYPNIFWWTGIISSMKYSTEELVELTWKYSININGKIGIGLSIGDLGELRKEYPDISIGTAIKKLEKILDEFPLLWSKKQENSEEKKIPLPKIAVGALGNKMINLAAEKANYLFLNSSRLIDIKRAQKIISEKNSKCKIIPLILLEPYSEIGLFSWYLVKKMLKYSPVNILESYGYNKTLINKIQELSDDYPTKMIDEKEIELKKVLFETIVTGNENEILNRINNIKKMNVDGIVIRVSVSKPESKRIFWENYILKIDKAMKT